MLQHGAFPQIGTMNKFSKDAYIHSDQPWKAWIRFRLCVGKLVFCFSVLLFSVLSLPHHRTVLRCNDIKSSGPFRLKAIIDT